MVAVAITVPIAAGDFVISYTNHLRATQDAEVSDVQTLKNLIYVFMWDISNQPIILKNYTIKEESDTFNCREPIIWSSFLCYSLYLQSF